MTELDRAALDRVLPAATHQADWDDVIGRFRTHRGRRRRRLVALAAATLVVVAGSAAALGTVRELVLHQGFIGLPPVGATPSTPESGELVLQWVGKSVTHKKLDGRGQFRTPWASAMVYADGRMIWSRDGQVLEGANELTGQLEQRLTPQGVELLRSEVAGLLDRSRELLETGPLRPRLDVPAPVGNLTLLVPRDYGSRAGLVQVRDGDRFVSLSWLRGIKKHLEEAGLEGRIATPEQLSALRRIDALMTDPESVLPASAWAVREVRAYVPSHYAVCLNSSLPKARSYLFSLLPAQAADVLRDKSWWNYEAAPVTHCFKLATEEAREVAEPLSGFHPAPNQPGRLAYQLAEAVNGLNPTTIWFEPYFPHGQIGCSACG